MLSGCRAGTEALQFDLKGSKGELKRYLLSFIGFPNSHLFPQAKQVIQEGEETVC